MLYAGLDLSRKRLDFHLLDGEGATVERGATPPDADGLQRLSERIARHGAPVRAAIESMNGARFVHDRLELAGSKWCAKTQTEAVEAPRLVLFRLSHRAQSASRRAQPAGTPPET
jgi:hypothetical protein